MSRVGTLDSHRFGEAMHKFTACFFGLILSALDVTQLLAPARAQTAATSEISRLFNHALFYAAPNGRPAEVACYMRRAQRLALETKSPDAAIKKWYEASGMDDLRVVLTRTITDVWSPFKKESALQPAISGFMADLTRKERPVDAVTSATRLADAVKVLRGESHLDYANALELVGDAKVFQHQYAEAAKNFASALEIRRAARPVMERYLGIEKAVDDADRQAEFLAKRNIGIVMSKLADVYWILGQESAAAKLRNDAKTREGEADRIRNLESADALLANRMAIASAHPSCVAALKY